MSKAKTLRVYDYVNHPYEAVRQVLSRDPETVFRNATKVAAQRAKTVASELHVNIGGIEIGADIAISVKSVEDQPKKIMMPEMTCLELEWKASQMPGLFPLMKAELSIYPLTSTETQLDLLGNYEVPFGVLGSAVNAVVGHRIAEASVHQFIKDVAVYLRKELEK
ncbi:MAG: hypothetical protein R2747_08555 [Pyrinomonadaceae bacterium]